MMYSLEPKTFSLPKSTKKDILLTITFCLLLTLIIFVIVLISLPELDKMTFKNIFFMFLSLFTFLGISIWQIFTIYTLTKYSISINDEGIWPSYLGKEEGLVGWGDIKRVHERDFLQRLDLSGSDGRVLLKVEYQLNDFKDLRTIIASRMAGDDLIKGYPLEIKAPNSTYWVYPFILFMPILFAAFSGWESNVIAAVGVLSAAFALLHFLTSVRGLILHPEALVVVYHFRQKRYDKAAVEMPDWKDSEDKKENKLFPVIELQVHPEGKSIKLVKLGDGSVQLMRTLTVWKLQE